MLVPLPLRIFLSFSLASTSFVAFVERAAACSPTICGVATALPTTESLPADAGGVFVYPGRHHTWSFEDFALELRLVEAGTSPIVLSVTWSEPPSIGPAFVAGSVDGALPVGAQLELWGRAACDPEGADDALPAPTVLRTWSIVAPLGAPTALGTVPPVSIVRSSVHIPTGAGSCSIEHETTVANVTLAFDASAEPWASTFRFETLVDGAPYFEPTSIAWFGGPVGPEPGGSSYGRGVDTVFTRCGDSTSGVVAGDHTIAFRAFLPDGRSFTSSPTTVEFSCEAATEPGRCSSVAGSRPRPELSLVVVVAASILVRTRRRRDRVGTR